MEAVTDGRRQVSGSLRPVEVVAAAVVLRPVGCCSRIDSSALHDSMPIYNVLPELKFVLLFLCVCIFPSFYLLFPSMPTRRNYSL